MPGPGNGILARFALESRRTRTNPGVFPGICLDFLRRLAPFRRVAPTHGAALRKIPRDGIDSAEAQDDAGGSADQSYEHHMRLVKHSDVFGLRAAFLSESSRGGRRRRAWTCEDAPPQRLATRILARKIRRSFPRPRGENDDLAFTDSSHKNSACPGHPPSREMGSIRRQALRSQVSDARRGFLVGYSPISGPIGACLLYPFATEI